MRLSMSRRFLLGGLAGSLAAHSGPSRAAPAKTGIIVGCWDGPYAEALQAITDAPFTRNTGVAVRQAVSDEQARVAKVAALAGEGSLDVALLSDVDAYKLSLGQIFAPVTTAGVSALPHVLAGLRVPYGVPQSSTALCIAYNNTKVTAPPRGFAALFEAARKGTVGFSSEIAIHNLAAAAVAQRGKGASLEAAKSIFLALKKAGTLRVYSTNEALGLALASGEVTMAPMWRSRAYVWKQDGRAIRDTVPDEGPIPFTILACVPKSSRQVPSAMRYLDALLHPEAQVAMAQRTGLLPTVEAARLAPELLREIGFTPTQRARFRPVSVAAVARNGVALRHFWDQELA